MVKTDSTREAFTQSLGYLMELDPRIVIVFADSVKVFRATDLAEKYTDRVFDVGIAEQNAVAFAAGLASCDLIPFVATYSGFITMRACEQVRTFIAYPGLNVKFVGANGGIFGGEREGVTHQFFEDIGVLRSIPGVSIIVPADANEVRVATREIVKSKGPAFMRVGSGRDPVIFEHEPQFKLGKINIVDYTGDDVAILSNGYLLSRALEASKNLNKQGINAIVVNVHTLKPLDIDGIISVLSRTGAAVTVEDHNIIGGLGSAVSEVIAENIQVPLQRVGLNDIFPESGMAFDLLDYYHMGAINIENAVKKVLSQKPVFLLKKKTRNFS